MLAVRFFETVLGGDCLVSPGRRRGKLAAAFAALVAGALLSLVRCGDGNAPRATETARAVPPELAQTFDRMLDDYRRENDLPGVASAVVLPGRALWTGGSGVADLETRAAFETDTLVPIGSISKNLTAALLVGLAEDEVVSLDDPVGKYVSGIPNGGRITIEHVLGLTSGLPGLGEEYRRAVISEPDRRWNPERALRYLGSPYAEPGRGFRYWDINFSEGFRFGDPNYLVAGLVIEAATGSTVAEEFERRLLGPLGLDDQIFLLGQQCVPRIAHGYQDLGTPPNVFAGDGDIDDTLGLGTRWRPRNSSDCIDFVPTPAFATATFTDGAFVASAPGLARWADSLFHARVVTRRSLERMLDFHSISFPEGGHRDYGLGVTEMSLAGIAWEHEGAYPGYASYMGYFVDDDVTVVVLTNAAQSPRPFAAELVSAVRRAAAGS